MDKICKHTQVKIAYTPISKFRVLIHQQKLAKIQNDGGVLGAGESISVNPGYANEVDKQSPFYANLWIYANRHTRHYCMECECLYS